MKNGTKLGFSSKPRALIVRGIILTGLALSQPAKADVISDWNRTASEYLTQNAGSHYSRGMTMVHVAQFDAVNAVGGGYTPYALEVVAPGASAEAAAAQAAYSVLTNISRATVSVLNTALARSLEGIAAGSAREDGIRLGKIAADRIIQLRAADNPDLPITPATSTALGKWRISPPNSSPGIGANSRYMLPWTLRSQSQFRPGPPPALNSAQYAADYDEARLLGARNSPTRTPDQTDAAGFHAAPDLAYLRPALASRALPLIESSRAVALYYMARTDAETAFLEAQYAYSFWRPYTAIRLADTDGNDGTAPEPAWTPLFDTPNHPEYPSGTCTFTTASVEVLMSVYGDNFEFTGTYNGASKPRQFARLSAAIDDAVVARIAAGAHFRNSCLQGVELGRRIAHHAMQNYLRPVPRLAGQVPQGSVGFQLVLSPARPFSYVIETSVDLGQWTPWQTNILGPAVLTDSGTSSGDRRFYRGLIRP